MSLFPESEVAFSRPAFGIEEEQAVSEVVRSGWVVGGHRQIEFENAFASRCGASYAVAVSSWTTGAFLVLTCWGIGPGDEVIVPSLTFIASVNVIRHVGATPVFVDIDPQTWNTTPNAVFRKITSRTRAIIAVDQLGMPCDLPGLRQIAESHDIKFLDDAACAFGSRIGDVPVGAFADASIFSLHARKVISTAEGGMILTDDEELQHRLRRLRHQGMSVPDFQRHGTSPAEFESYDEVGYNFRLTDIQAALGICQLSRADDILRRRAVLAERYARALSKLPGITPPFVPQGITPNWQSYQITLDAKLVAARKAILQGLYEHGVHARRGVMASHLEPPYASPFHDLPNTERAAAATLQLPIYPDLTHVQQDRVIEALTHVLGHL